jgi:class 3 adenylate cyclase
MARKLKSVDEVEGAERFLNLPKGSLRNFPRYALTAAIEAIDNVRYMEQNSLFRPGLYYIVLADLVGNTAFNAKYGNEEGDRRVEWFHTAAIESIGQIEPLNYVAFSKTIGDASLLIFSAFEDVYKWSEKFKENLDGLSDEYDFMAGEDREESREDRGRVKAFTLKARRLVHIGEVAYKEGIDPLSLAVSQTFKIEKHFSEIALGCTQAVADAVGPKLAELGLRLRKNKAVPIPGFGKSMTYYIREKSKQGNEGLGATESSYGKKSKKS